MKRVFSDEERRSMRLVALCGGSILSVAEAGGTTPPIAAAELRRMGVPLPRPRAKGGGTGRGRGPWS